MRDFYDIYILSKLQKENINNELLKEAIRATAKRRGTYKMLSDANKILEQIDKSAMMKNLWKRYQTKFSYAEEIEWVEVMQSVKLKFEGFTEEK